MDQIYNQRLNRSTVDIESILLEASRKTDERFPILITLTQPISIIPIESRNKLTANQTTIHIPRYSKNSKRVQHFCQKTLYTVLVQQNSRIRVELSYRKIIYVQSKCRLKYKRKSRLPHEEPSRICPSQCLYLESIQSKAVSGQDVFFPFKQAKVPP